MNTYTVTTDEYAQVALSAIGVSDTSKLIAVYGEGTTVTALVCGTNARILSVSDPDNIKGIRSTSLVLRVITWS